MRKLLSLVQNAVLKKVVSLYRLFCSLAHGGCYKTIARLPKPHTMQSPNWGLLGCPSAFDEIYGAIYYS